MSTLRQLAAEVRKVWNAPAGRAWSQGEVAIVKLLRAIEEEPKPTKRDVALPGCESKEHGHCGLCGWCEVGGQCICYAR